MALKDDLIEDVRLCRNHSIRVQGFDVSYEDQWLLKARYSAGRVSELYSDWHKDKVQIVPLLDVVAMLEQIEQTLQVQDARIRQLEQRINHYRRGDASLRFTTTRLTAFAMFQAGLLIWIATH